MRDPLNEKIANQLISNYAAIMEAQSQPGPPDSNFEANHNYDRCLQQHLSTGLLLKRHSSSTQGRSPEAGGSISTATGGMRLNNDASSSALLLNKKV